MELSNRVNIMPSSPIRKLVPYAQKAIESGKKVFHLNIGQPDISSPSCSIEALSKYKKLFVEYSPSEGFMEYRKKLTQFYNIANKLNLDYSNILITTGGSEALIFTFNTCLNPGDEIIIPEPFYANYNGFAAISGINIVPVTSFIKNNFDLPSIDSFEKKINSKTKAILICNPGNPTGCLYSEEDLKKLCRIVKKYNLFLIADEVYREFCYDGAKHYSVLNFPEISQNTIVIDSVSKRYSLCGARIGALITRNKLIFNQALKFAQARLSPPTMGQILGMSALDAPKSYFINIIEEYTKRRNILVDMLNSIEGVNCISPKGAFYAIAELPVEDTEDFCIWLLDKFSYKDKTVMIAPAQGFYKTLDIGRKQVRIAYVLKENDLKEAITCLAEGLKKYTLLSK